MPESRRARRNHRPVQLVALLSVIQCSQVCAGWPEHLSQPPRIPDGFRNQEVHNPVPYLATGLDISFRTNRLSTIVRVKSSWLMRCWGHIAVLRHFALQGHYRCLKPWANFFLLGSLISNPYSTRSASFCLQLMNWSGPGARKAR